MIYGESNTTQIIQKGGFLMNFQTWIESIHAMAGIFGFDILPDGSFSEIRMYAVNQHYQGVLHMRPDAPEFYPGISYKHYFNDVNFESYCYKSASTQDILYSYVNAYNCWMTGFYLPVDDPEMLAQLQKLAPPSEGEKRTVYCCYVLKVEPAVQTEAMAERSAEVSAAVIKLSMILHKEQDFYQTMRETVTEIGELCGASHCAIAVVDTHKQKCTLITPNGPDRAYLEEISRGMGRTPFETALAWEAALNKSDCLLLEDLKVVQERDPVWYESLVSHGMHNIVLYEIRCQKTLVGFIWAGNYDVSKMEQIKGTLELTTFLTGAVIANHQLVSRLEIMSTVDGLTQVSNRNAMNQRVEKLVSGEDERPAVMGVVYADLNGLKTVNDEKGHEAGDKLLVRAARLLKIAFDDFEIYRAGGDEFVILLPDAPEQVMQEQIAQLRALTENTADVRFAVGAVYCRGKYDIRQAMHDADEQMYADKEAYYLAHPEKKRRMA